ncbi:MAG TPA: nucleotide disphospho-sugar-binding domain-containing protein, partial [Caulobacteraceae bacterium]
DPTANSAIICQHPSGGGVNILALTFDAAGNAPPMLGLTEALIARGHAVAILGHDNQAARIEAAGAAFLHLQTAPQRDGASAEPLTMAWAESFDHAAAWDLFSAARRRGADVLVVDSLLSACLDAAIASHWRTIDLCHTPYEIMATFLDGRFRPGLEGSDLTVISSYAAFHAGPPVPANAVFAGPLRPAAKPGAWTRRHPDKPLVLASLSTGQQNQRPVLERLCRALAEVDAEALVTTGAAMSPEGLAQGPLMSLERDVPHETLAPMADLVVTHAGHGTLSFALAAGVPMLCLPGGGDQPANADRVVALELGERLDLGAAPEVVAEAVRRLLADKALRERARAFARIVNAEPGPKPALERIEALARQPLPGRPDPAP